MEGQTEETFVKDVLAEHLRTVDVVPYPVLLGRARGRHGGDNVGIDRLVSEMVDLHRNYDAVTSLVDFYGFRDKEDRTVEELEEHLIERIEGCISDARRVFPYVQKHEFEALLFSDVAAFKAIGSEADGVVETPEDIDDDPENAPSRRIAGVVAGYHKRLHGPPVTLEAGLAKIRAECSRFRAWLTRLEGLANPA